MENRLRIDGTEYYSLPHVFALVWLDGSSRRDSLLSNASLPRARKSCLRIRTADVPLLILAKEGYQVCTTLLPLAKQTQGASLQQKRPCMFRRASIPSGHSL